MRCVKAVIPDQRLYLTMIQQMLEEKGIPAIIQGEILANIKLNYYLGEAGLKLCVLNDDDVDRAIKLIEEFESLSVEELGKEDQYQPNTRRKWLLGIGKTYLFFYLFGGVMVYVVVLAYQFISGHR